MLLEQWWAWMAAALVMAILEVVIPGYIFLGFAVGAFVVGLLMVIGIGMGLAAKVLVFAILSLIAFVALRRLVGLRHGQVKVWDRDINDD